MDALGSVRGVVNPAGEVLEGQDYAPYGTPFGHTGTAQTPFGFTGEVTDASGLVYLRARYYLPELGVFPSLDPVEEGNRYGYVGGDVANRVDPSGECAGNPCDISDPDRDHACWNLAYDIFSRFGITLKMRRWTRLTGDDWSFDEAQTLKFALDQIAMRLGSGNPEIGSSLFRTFIGRPRYSQNVITDMIIGPQTYLSVIIDSQYTQAAGVTTYEPLTGEIYIVMNRELLKFYIQGSQNARLLGDNRLADINVYGYLSTYVHEIGHALIFTPNIFSFNILEDYSKYVAGSPALSNYGATSPHEDFAEAWRIFVLGIDLGPDSTDRVLEDSRRLKYLSALVTSLRQVLPRLQIPPFSSLQAGNAYLCPSAFPPPNLGLLPRYAQC